MQFVTPTKSSTSIKTSPNSVTKLDSDDLYYLGIESIPDAMRLVPGMIVSDLYRSEIQIGYHGLNASLPRRQDILYNGSSIYKAGDSGIHWGRLPFSVDDLESIEVVRGSSTIDYGSNAMTSATNLIQTPITLESPVFGSVISGSSNEEILRGGFSFNQGPNHFYLRAFDRQSDGFDFAEGTSEYDNRQDAEGLLVSGEHDIDNNRILDWSLSYSDYAFSYPDFSFVGNTGFAAQGGNEDTQTSARGSQPGSEKNIHATVKLSGSGNNSNWNMATKYSLYDRKQAFDFCNIQQSFLPLFAELDASPNVNIVPQDFPLIFQSGLSTGIVQLNESIVGPLSAQDQALLQQIGAQMQSFGPALLTQEICGSSSIDTKEERINLGGLYSYQARDNLEINLGFDLSHTQADSDTYLQGNVERNSLLLSQNLKYEGERYVVNAGLMSEYDNYLDEFIFSPRASWGYHLNENFTLRTLYSVSRRSPDIHETSRKWQYEIQYEEGTVDLTGATSGFTFRLAESPDNLKPEKIESSEVGFVYTQGKNYLIDFKVFREDMTNLISEPFTYLTFDLSNDGEILKEGAEISGALSLGSARFGLGYTYMDWESNNPYEEGLIARHTGNVWGIFHLPYDVYLGMSYSGYSGSPNGSYNKTDVTLTKPFKVGSSTMDIQIGMKRYPELISTFTEYSTTDPVNLGYDNRNQYFIRLSAEL